VSSTSEDFKGYRSPTLDVLQANQATVWSKVTLHTTGGDFSGLILPRSETADADHVVLKLDTGYNIGVRHDTIEKIDVTGRKVANYQIPEKEFPFDPAKPRVKLFGTGGTIASRLDYRTGAVIPAFSPGELYGSVPELADICNMETEKLYGVFSGKRCGRDRGRPRHRHHASHRRRPQFHAAGLPRAHRHGRQPAQQRPAQ